MTDTISHRERFYSVPDIQRAAAAILNIGDTPAAGERASTAEELPVGAYILVCGSHSSGAVELASALSKAPASCFGDSIPRKPRIRHCSTVNQLPEFFFDGPGANTSGQAPANVPAAVIAYPTMDAYDAEKDTHNPVDEHLSMLRAVCAEYGVPLEIREQEQQRQFPSAALTDLITQLELPARLQQTSTTPAAQ